MDVTTSDIVVVLSNLPDRDSAVRLAEALVEKRLAACVNVLAPVSSVYKWKGAIEHAEEVPVLIKTRGALYAEVEAQIREIHPYEVPEIIAVPVVRGLPEYLDWVAEETSLRIG